MSDASDGITLGRHYDDATDRAGGKVIYEGERHLLLFGPNGTGKGTRFLIPNLLSIKDRSIIVIDPKGELAAVTADYRRTVGEVVMLNPFNVLGLGSASAASPPVPADAKGKTCRMEQQCHWENFKKVCVYVKVCR